MNFSLSLHLLGVEVAKCSHTVWNSCGNYEMRLILAIKMNIKHECLQCRRYIDSTELQQHLSHRKLTGEKSSRALVHRVNLFQSLPRVLGVLYIHGWRKKRQESSQFWDIKWMRLSTMMCFHLTLTPKIPVKRNEVSTPPVPAFFDFWAYFVCPRTHQAT